LKRLFFGGTLIKTERWEMLTRFQLENAKGKGTCEN